MYFMIHSQKHVNYLNLAFKLYFLISFRILVSKCRRWKPIAWNLEPSANQMWGQATRCWERRRERERKKESARCHDNAAYGSHLGCERGSVSESERERPCSGHAAAGELNSTLTCCGGCCEVLWRDWNIGTRDAARPGLAVSQWVRRVSACVRSYDGCGDCWTSAPACARTATSGDIGMAAMAAAAAATAAEAAKRRHWGK